MTFWLIAATLGALVGLAIKLRWRYGLEIFQATAAGLLIVIVWRLWAVRELRKKQEQNEWHRLAELQREVRPSGGSVRIEGMGPTLLPVIGILITALLVTLALGTEQARWWVFATVPAIAVLIAAIMRIAKWGQPLLILSREGVQPAGYGLLPWSAIFGIEYQTPETKHTSGTALNLYVPGLQARLHSAHPFVRFWRGIPGIRAANYVDVITIPMRKPSELPRVIERLCRSLWKDATGHTHHWSVRTFDPHLQFTHVIADTDRQLRDASRSNEEIEQMRASLRELKRHAQVAKDNLRSREAWTKVWTIPGAFALALFIGQVPLHRLIAFVPADEWSKRALVIAGALVAIGWVLVIVRARKIFAESFSTTRLVQVLTALAITSLLVVPMTWLVIADIGGVLAANGHGPNEEITVVATKQERTSRRGCDYALDHPGLGNQLCLVRAEYLTYPNQVPVVLSIRRNRLGYKVYEQRIALPASDPALK